MVFQTELREKRCYTVIDLSALKENMITAKKLLSPEMKVNGVHINTPPKELELGARRQSDSG